MTKKGFLSKIDAMSTKLYNSTIRASLVEELPQVGVSDNMCIAGVIHVNAKETVFSVSLKHRDSEGNAEMSTGVCFEIANIADFCASLREGFALVKEEAKDMAFGVNACFPRNEFNYCLFIEDGSCGINFAMSHSNTLVRSTDKLTITTQCELDIFIKYLCEASARILENTKKFDKLNADK